MKRRKIFNRLMEFRAQAVRGNEELDQYFDLIVGDVGRVLGLRPEDCAALRGPHQRRRELAPDEQHDAATRQPVKQRTEIGRKEEDGEIVYRFVDIYGNAEFGYFASYDEYFTPNRQGGNEPEFYEVRFQTSIFPTIDEAVKDAMKFAISEAIAGGFTITV